LEELLELFTPLSDIVVSEPRQEGACSCPTNHKLGVGPSLIIFVLLETSNILSVDDNSAKSEGKSLRDVDSEEVPSGRVVSCPKTRESVRASETSTTDDEISLVLSGCQIIEAFIGSFMEVVRIHVPFLDKGS